MPVIERIAFTVRGEPMGKPRMTQRDKFKPSKAVQKYRAWADSIKWAAKPFVKEPLAGALELNAVFYLSVPDSYSAKLRAACLAGQVSHTVAPDLKNLIAGVEDALNKLAWPDDSVICAYGKCIKLYDDGRGARAVVLAYRVGQSLDERRGKLARAGRALGYVT